MKETHIFNTVEIVFEYNKLAVNWHHLFQRLFLLVFLLTSIKWGLSIWKHAYKWDLSSPRKVASLRASEAFYMVEFLFLKTPGHHVSQRPRDLKETHQKNEVNCKFEIWFETPAFKTKHSMPCLGFFSRVRYVLLRVSAQCFTPSPETRSGIPLLLVVPVGWKIKRLPLPKDVGRPGPASSISAGN